MDTKVNKIVPDLEHLRVLGMKNDYISRLKIQMHKIVEPRNSPFRGREHTVSFKEAIRIALDIFLIVENTFLGSQGPSVPLLYSW